MDYSKEIKDAIKNKKGVIGTERCLKMLRLDKLVKVFITKNTPKIIVSQIKHYAKIQGTQIIELSMENDELGTICKKPFEINIFSIMK